VTRVADRDPAKALDALREQVDDLELFLRVLVEQQVELIEGRPRDEPVMLLVQRRQDHRVREDLVQERAALRLRRVRQRDRERSQRTEALELGAFDVEPGCRRVAAAVPIGA
jgi:hypothetical protein